MSYIGTSFLGSTIYQDQNRPRWAKIDGVVMGNSWQYGYVTKKSSDIGKLLDNMLTDGKVVVVNYNWKNGYAYVKSGFDPQAEGDCSNNNDYTAFFVMDRVSGNPFAPPAPAPAPVPAPIVSKYVTQSDGTFYVDGKQFVPVGFNCYWLGFGLQYDPPYPSHDCIEEMFAVASKMGATVIRSHTLGHSSGSKDSLRPAGRVLNVNAWDTIDYGFYMARKYDIRLICPLTDNYFWINGGYFSYCDDRGLPRPSFWTDPNLIDDFKNYIKQWLEHVNKYTGEQIKNDPYLFLIETGNELGNIRQSDDRVPPKSWISEITAYIKSIDGNHLILDGSDECLGKSDNFDIPSVDVFSRHFYWRDFDTMHAMSARAAKVGKPFIVGEYDSHWKEADLREIEKDPNIKGSMFWSMFPHAYGLNGGPYIRHDDGYSQYYPETSGDLLDLTNHIRRMRGLPQVSTLP